MFTDKSEDVTKIGPPKKDCHAALEKSEASCAVLHRLFWDTTVKKTSNMNIFGQMLRPYAEFGRIVCRDVNLYYFNS